MIVYTVECVKNCHFRVNADRPDRAGRIEKVWDPRCPYCGTVMFRRWWRHEMPDSPAKPVWSKRKHQ